MRREDLERRLRATRVPGEDEAATRSWEVVRRALGSGGGRARRASPRLAFALTAVAALAIALTPAGAKVGDLIDDVTGGSEPKPALSKIPGGGELLVSSRQGPWVVREDGSKRLLGDYQRATFSPGGLFVAVTDGRELLAVEPDGDPRWAITRPARVRDPLWSPSGFRIAYRSGDRLRVVAGDGTEDRLVGDGGPAAWRPLADVPKGAESAEILAYATPRERIVAVDADGPGTLWRSAPGEPITEVAWSGRDQVVVVREGKIDVLDGRDGSPRQELRQPRRTSVAALDASPDGRRLAFVRNDPVRGSSELVLARLGDGGVRSRAVFSATGAFQFGEVLFSPDGKRLLLTWPELDQWLFIRPDENEKQLGSVQQAVGDIAAQFDPGSAGPSRGPIVEGWCCRFADDS